MSDESKVARYLRVRRRARELMIEAAMTAHLPSPLPQRLPAPLPQRSPEAVRVMASEQLARDAVQRYGAEAGAILVMAAGRAGEMLREGGDSDA